MKGKALTSLVALLLAAALIWGIYLITPAYAVPRSNVRNSLGAFTGPRAGTAQDDNVKASLDLAHTDIDVSLALLLNSSKAVYYCDSTESTGTEDGLTWATAVDTLSEAVALCTVSGCTILVAGSHNEALTVADSADVDKMGTVVIGMGYGTNKPTFDYDNSAGEFVIGAANVVLKNLRFRASSGAVTAGLEIEAAGDNFSVIDCEFVIEASTDEFTSAISVATTADNGLIEGCIFRAGTAQAAQAIYIVSGCIGLRIVDNEIYGDYSVACIKGLGSGVDNLIIRDNVLYNGNLAGDGGINAQPVIELAEAGSGFIFDNRMVCAAGTAVAARVGDDFTFMNNYLLHTDGDEFSGGLESAGVSVTVTSAAD
jgi:hypothetical protein